jgi:hypothetical protein
MKELEAARARYATGCHLAIGPKAESLAVIERRSGQFRVAYLIQAHRQFCPGCRGEV